MKLRRLIAAVAAGAMALAMTIVASADTTFTKKAGEGYNGTDAFEFDNFDVLSDPDAVFVVTYNDTNDNWGDIGFGFSEGEAWRSCAINNPAGEGATIEIPVSEVIKNCFFKDIANVTYGKIEGYNGCLITNVEVKAAGASGDAAGDDNTGDAAGDDNTGDANTGDNTGNTSDDTTGGDSGNAGTGAAAGAALALVAVAGSALVVSKKKN